MFRHRALKVARRFEFEVLDKPKAQTASDELEATLPGQPLWTEVEHRNMERLPGGCSAVPEPKTETTGRPYMNGQAPRGPAFTRPCSGGECKKSVRWWFVGRSRLL